VRADNDGVDMTNLNFLFAAYTAVWVLLFLYILTLGRRNRSLGKEIEELRELLQRRTPS
jgi:CcmD family protein